MLTVCNWSPDIPNHNLRTIIHNGNIGGKNLGAFEDFELIRQAVSTIPYNYIHSNIMNNVALITFISIGVGTD